MTNTNTVKAGERTQRDPNERKSARSVLGNGKPFERAMQHTPGPWKAIKVDENGQYAEWEVRTDPPPILSGIPPVAIIGYVTKRGEADAHLIAAAPELLAACKADLHDLEEIRAGVDGLEGDPKEVTRIMNLIDGRKLALCHQISKAEGRE